MGLTPVEIADKYQSLIEWLISYINEKATFKMKARLDFDRVQIHYKGSFIYDVIRKKKQILVRDHSLSDKQDFHSVEWDLEEGYDNLKSGLSYYFDSFAQEACQRKHIQRSVGRMELDANDRMLAPDIEE